MKNIIWDLDGTLVDTAPGIVLTYTYLMQNQYLPYRSKAEIQRLIGPRLQVVFQKEFGLHPDQAQKMVVRFREYYNIHGLSYARPYSDILNVLKTLGEERFTQSIVTNKQEDLAKDLCARYSLDNFMEVIIGGDPYGEKSKLELIEQCLQRLGTRDAIMIGDTEEDKQAAAKAGIKFFGVSYGYGFRNIPSYAEKAMEIPELLNHIIGNKIEKIYD